jgi:phosphoenolpyruvate carboxykinase (ATP)
MRLPHTRALLAAALDGTLAAVPTRHHARFGLAMPTTCPGVPDEVLDPKAMWADGAAYDRQAQIVAQRFETNFAQFAGDVGEDVKAAGIRALGA